MNRAINKDKISKQTKANRKRAIDCILYNIKSENRAVNNILGSVEQQNFELTHLKEKVLDSNLTFEDIYIYLKSYKKGVIPLIIALFIKDNIENLIVYDQLDEIAISSDLLNEELENLSSLSLTILSDIAIYNEYKKIFYSDNIDKNIFSNIMEGMYNWFFNLDSYTINSSKKYIGQGKYQVLKEEILKFKDSLRIIQKNPYWYLSVELPQIFTKNTLEQLHKAKDIMSNSMLELKTTLNKDIELIFPESLKTWYTNLPHFSKNRIYRNREEKFFDICLSTYQGNELVEQIAKFLTGLSVEYWNDDMPKIFYDRLLGIRNTIEGHHEEKLKTGFVIKHINKGIEEYEKFLTMSTDLDENISQLIINDIKSIFSDYGNSINHCDKIALILKIALEEGI